MSRKLDALFAERALGVEPGNNPDQAYCESLDAAWRGVEKLVRDEWGFSLEDDASQWVVEVGMYRATAATPALAVVKACLLAAGVTQEEIEEAER